MRRTSLFQAVVVGMGCGILLFTSSIQATQAQDYEPGYRESWAGEFDRSNVSYKATDVVGAINPSDLSNSGAILEDTPYYVLNRSIVFGPYEEIPDLNLTLMGTVDFTTNDWREDLTRDNIVDHGGYSKGYFADDGSVAVIVSLACSTYGDGYRSYRYDEHQPAPDDGIYITFSYLCPTERFGLSAHQYITRDWTRTDSCAEMFDHGRSLEAINRSICQGMYDYEVIGAKAAEQINWAELRAG